MFHCAVPMIRSNQIESDQPFTRRGHMVNSVSGFVALNPMN